MKKIFCVILFALFAVSAEAQEMKFSAKAGYNIGGNAPLGMPASIRRLDKFGLKPNWMFGVEVEKMFDKKWGLTAGIRFENKGMMTDAKVKGYKMEMTQGGETLDGYFTGFVETNVMQWMLTFPVQAAYNVNNKVRLRLGAYASLLVSKDFFGFAYDGYIRKGDPTGPKVILGNDEESRGKYCFKNDMRDFQIGVAGGFDLKVWKKLGFFADINFGVTPLFNSDFKVMDFKMYPIFATLGVSYGF